MRAFARKHPIALLSAVTFLVTALLIVMSFVGGTEDPLVRVSIPAAFLGGVLSILSPCSVALLPAFFAFSFRQRAQLVRMTLIFWLGLATSFVPLGFSSTFVARAFAQHREFFFLVVGFVFLALGLWNLLAPIIMAGGGGGLRAYGKSPLGIYLTGVVFSFSTGTCAAPVIGGIFTLSAASGTAAYAFLLLFLYSLGLVAPLFFLAYFFDRLSVMQLPWIRGKLWTVRLFGKTLPIHSTELITSLLFFFLAVLFFFFHGTYGLGSLFTKVGLTELYLRLNEGLVTH